MLRTLNFGVVGTGAIAEDFARALARSERCRISSVLGTSCDKARAFASRFGISSHAQDLPELLRDPAVEAVYIATPHPLHEPQALACIDAGKAVLCEKPIATSAEGARSMLEAAKLRGVFVMEGYMYRLHPLIAELCKRLRSGAIGAVRHVRADFGFAAVRDEASRNCHWWG